MSFLKGRMSIEDELCAAQERYLRFFVAARDREMAQNSDIAAEMLVLRHSPTLQAPYHYLRADLLTRDARGAVLPLKLHLDPEDGKVHHYHFGAFTVELHPFSWCQTRLLLATPPPKLALLERWMLRALDVDHCRPCGPHGERGSAHCFSPLQRDGAWWSLSIDFGTAPADALLELIQLLVRQGVRCIVIR